MFLSLQNVHIAKQAASLSGLGVRFGFGKKRREKCSGPGLETRTGTWPADSLALEKSLYPPLGTLAMTPQKWYRYVLYPIASDIVHCFHLLSGLGSSSDYTNCYILHYIHT